MNAHEKKDASVLMHLFLFLRKSLGNFFPIVEEVYCKNEIRTPAATAEPITPEILEAIQ